MILIMYVFIITVITRGLHLRGRVRHRRRPHECLAARDPRPRQIIEQCVCIYIYICIYVYECVYIYIYICEYVYIYIYI